MKCILSLEFTLKKNNNLEYLKRHMDLVILGTIQAGASWLVVGVADLVHQSPIPNNNNSEDNTDKVLTEPEKSKIAQSNNKNKHALDDSDAEMPCYEETNNYHNHIWVIGKRKLFSG